MNLIESLRWRYATKQFDPEKVVPDEHLQQILLAGNLAPTSYGLQPFRFVVIRNQAIQDQLVEFSFNQQQVAEASHVIVIATRTNLDVSYVNEFTARMEAARDLPDGALDGYRNLMVGTVSSMSVQDLNEWNAKQAYLALGMMMSAAATVGVDSCPMEGFLPEKYDQLLRLSEHYLQSCVVLPIGYRAATDQSQHFKKVRWPMQQMVLNIS